MTRNQCLQEIQKVIEALGFAAETNRYQDVPQITELSGGYFGISIFEETLEHDFEAKRERKTFSYQGRVRQMGGAPSVAELLKAAEEIQRGAFLVRALQTLNLEFTRIYGQDD